MNNTLNWSRTNNWIGFFFTSSEYENFDLSATSYLSWAESKLITAKQVWLDSILGIFYHKNLSVTSSTWDFILVFTNSSLKTD